MGDAFVLPYPAYVIVAQLSAMKWPRKSGLFGKRVVNGDALNGAWAAMAQTSMGLGAGRPRVACQLLTQLFSNRDWASEPSDVMLAALDPAKQINLEPNLLPWEALIRRYTEITPPNLPWDELSAPTMINVWTVHGGAGVIYGLLHSREVEIALDRDRATYVAQAPEAIKHGLNIPPEPPYPNNEAFYSWAEATLHAFERRAGALPQPAPQLLAAAALRERV